MTQFLLVRHGESEHNRKELIQGQIDSELTEEGRKQAEDLAENLSDQEFDAIYSSDLERARETAEIINEHHGLEIIETEKLRERDLGELEGSHYTEWNNVEKEDHHEWSPENGESLKDHKQRASDVLGEIAENNCDKVLVVAHGGLIRAMLFSILNAKSRQAWRIKLENCSQTELEYTEEDGWRIERVGCSPSC